MTTTPHRIAASLLGALAMTSPAFAQESDEELVKQLSNPVASLISVPFQSNLDFNMGPLDEGTKYTMNFQPVIPISLNADYNLIIRTIVPYVSQDDVFGKTSQNGLSDIVQSFFFSPKEPVGGWILGYGPVLLYPTATDNLLGAEKWAAGPTALALKQNGGWTHGVLANHLWSYAGESDRNDVNATFVQPFVSYSTKTKTTFSVNAEATYDWNESQWLVPVNASVSQLVKIGNMPVQFAVGGKYYAEGPSGAPEWGLRFTITPLFPTGKKPAPMSVPMSTSK